MRIRARSCCSFVSSDLGGNANARSLNEAFLVVASASRISTGNSWSRSTSAPKSSPNGSHGSTSSSFSMTRTFWCGGSPRRKRRYVNAREVRNSSTRRSRAFCAALPVGFEYSFISRSTLLHITSVPAPPAAASLRSSTCSGVGSGRWSNHSLRSCTKSRSHVAACGVLPSVARVTTVSWRHIAVEAVFRPSPNFPRLAWFCQAAEPYVIALMRPASSIPCPLSATVTRGLPVGSIQTRTRTSVAPAAIELSMMSSSASEGS